MEPADANTSAGKGLAGIDFCGLVDPAALAAIGIQQPKGQPTDPLDFPGCTWKQGSTLLKLSTALGTNDDLASGDKQDFSGFPGAAKYNDVTGDCVVTINIGPDQLQLDVGDTSGDNEAFSQKRCEVGVDMAQKVVAKIKK